MKIEGKNVLVTGAGGFIGSHLIEALVNKGSNVRAFVRYNSRNDWGLMEILSSDIKNAIEVFTGDIRDPFIVKRAVADRDVVFHLASLIAIPYSYRAPSSYVEINIVGTLNIMQAALECQVAKVIHTSTSEVYGTAQYTPIDELHPLQGQSPYSASKIGADKIAESYHLSFNLPVAIIRPFNTYGPRQSARAIIPTVITQILEKERVEVGLLESVRDFTFVKDTVDGFIHMAECEGTIGQVVNVGSGKGISIGQLIDLILHEMGVDKPVITAKERLRPKNSEVMKLICDRSKAHRILNWEPTISLEQGLQETIAFYTDNAKFYKADLYNV